MPVKTKPILFSAPMILALLAGTKTQTRRIIKAPTARGGFLLSFNHGVPEYQFGPEDCKPNGDLKWHRNRYGEPGDLLWVRETCSAHERESDMQDGVLFDADNAFVPIAPTLEAADDWIDLNWYNAADGLTGNTVPSIHMPRWASRLTLRVKEVRLQRLHEITDADAQAEGIVWSGEIDGRVLYDVKHQPSPGVHSQPFKPTGWVSPVAAYKFLWDSINGVGSAAANPWVWAIEFGVIQKNVDVVLKSP